MVGAVIGISILNSSGVYFLGIFFILISYILFLAAQSELEKKLKLTSSIKEDNIMKRLAEETAENQQVKREIDHLVYELSKGNLEAGLGHPRHIKGTNIFYLRGRNGGRLYYRKTQEGYETVGKSGKGRIQDRVIERLKELYSN